MSIPYLISEKHTHKLLYAHSLYLVNYIIIRQCFMCKIAPSDEFLPKSSPFLLVIFFVFPFIWTSNLLHLRSKANYQWMVVVLEDTLLPH